LPRLSIVVLPFVNIGGDQEQDYFVDGITESLTTDLSRLPNSFVIARNTAFTYKGKPVDVKRVGLDLGVAYVIEGSVQRAGNRMRVNVQLIDAISGAHLWAERFDRALTDLFQIQDEIVGRLARMLDVELTAAVVQAADRSHSADANSIDLTFRGKAALNRGLSKDAQLDAIRYFEQAVAIDPNNAEALAGLAHAYNNLVANFMEDRAALVAAEAAALKAIKLAPNNPRAHQALGNVYRNTNRAEQAISELEKALSLDHNFFNAYPLMGIAKIAIGKAEEAEEHIAKAMLLSPKDPMLHAWYLVAGAAKLFVGQDAEAISWLSRAIEANRSYSVPYFYLASAYAQLDNLAEARKAVDAGLAVDPRFTIRRYLSNAYSDQPTYLKQRERVVAGLRKAGLPE
jgi:TolB-like protein/Flp pilus assembly protein TadD